MALNIPGLLAMLQGDPNALAQLASSQGVAPPTPAMMQAMPQPQPQAAPVGAVQSQPLSAPGGAVAPGNATSLGQLLQPQPQSPLAGVKAPPAPVSPVPGTPGAPQPSQAINPAAPLIQLLLGSQGIRPGGNPMQGGAPPSLASMLTGGR